MSLDDPVLAPVLATQLDTQLEPEPAASGLPSRFACFVTGTDTEIGKTLISSAILHTLVQSGVRACGMKPVAAGAEQRDGVWHNDDCDQLIAAGNVTLPQNITTPFLLREAAAPHIAAELEDQYISPVPILAAYLEVSAASDAVVVEGVGGFRVPLNESFDTADLAEQLDLPVALVVGLRLGRQRSRSRHEVHRREYRGAGTAHPRAAAGPRAASGRAIRRRRRRIFRFHQAAQLASQHPHLNVEGIHDVPTPSSRIEIRRAASSSRRHHLAAGRHLAGGGRDGAVRPAVQ